MAFEEGVNGMFYFSLATLICSSLSLLIRFCYKSKFSEFKCFCIKVKRDIDIELKENLQLGTEKIVVNWKIIYKL